MPVLREGELLGFSPVDRDPPEVRIVLRPIVDEFKPDIIITNSGGACMPGYEQTPILMNETETFKVLDALPDATLIAVHLEALDHCTVTRQSLKQMAIKNKIDSNRFLVPEDGQWMELHRNK